MSSDSREIRDELEAALETRRELGTDFDRDIAESFVAKIGSTIDARVDARLRQRRPGGASNAQRLALAIVSIAVAFPLTAIMAIAMGPEALPALLVVWGGAVLVNLAFNLSARRS